MEYIYIPIILLLYARTWNYKNLIDDPIPRAGYLWDITSPKDRVHFSFYDKDRSPMYTVTNIGIYIAVCVAIHACFGWKIALLYAVMPTNVSGVAWATGNYYMTTMLFIMVAYLLNTQFIWGVVPASVFYFTALHSTVSAIPYFFYMVFAHWTPLNLLLIVPLCCFLFGKRFRHGLRVRKEGHASIGVTAGVFRWKHLYFTTKILAYYTVINLWPSRLGFFHDYGRDEAEIGAMSMPTRDFWLALTLLGVFSAWAIQLDWRMWAWWFFYIGVFGQFIVFGQLLSERYLYIANLGFCGVLVAFLEPYPYLYTIMVTLWFYRSHTYIPAWRHNINLFSYGISAFPYAVENYTNTSSYYIERKEYNKAIPHLQIACKFAKGGVYKLWGNLANAYAHTGRLESAIYCLEMALKKCKVPKDSVYFMDQLKEFNGKLFDVREHQRKINQVIKRAN